MNFSDLSAYFTQTMVMSTISMGGTTVIGGSVKAGRELLRALAHATFNGTMRMAQGGKFEHGFLSGFVSSLLGSTINNNMSIGVKVAMSAAIGGTAEALGGGKFANGAVTGAYVMMFNHLMHEWHPTGEAAATSAKGKTTTTGNETSVLVYEDDSGKNHFWESPHHPNNSPTSSTWIEPPPDETSDLTLVREFHYSVKDGPLDKYGKPTIIMGSYGDWLVARDLNIIVTHHTIGVGSWIFRPTITFVQPQAILYKKYINWNKENPIKQP